MSSNSKSNIQSRETFAGVSTSHSPSKINNRQDTNLYAGNTTETDSVESVKKSDFSQGKVKKILFRSRKHPNKRSISNNSGNSNGNKDV